MFPDTLLIAERHADLLRQADQQHLARLAQSREKSVRLDWRQLMVNWLQQQRAPKPAVTNAVCGEVLCC